MQHFYRNAVYIGAIFLLVIFMQYLRHGSFYLSEVLSLGLWYSIGLVAAVLFGRSVVMQFR